MKTDRTKPDRVRVSSGPDSPAYDNPVGNKGDLIAGNNVVEAPRPAPPAKPQGHDSDENLGRKPPQ